MTPREKMLNVSKLEKTSIQSAEHAFTIFELCELKTHIESKVINPKTGNVYQYSFKLISDEPEL